MERQPEVERKLEKLADVNNQQDIKLAKLDGQLAHMTTLVEHLVRNHDKLVEISAVNSESLQTHIRRTNLLQSRQNKIMVLLSVAVGASLTMLGPKALGLLGFLI